MATVAAQGVSVVRIPATEVMRDIDDVVDALVRAALAKIEAEARAPSTALRAVPSPFHGGDGS